MTSMCHIATYIHTFLHIQVDHYICHCNEFQQYCNSSTGWKPYLDTVSGTICKLPLYQQISLALFPLFLQFTRYCSYDKPGCYNFLPAVISTIDNPSLVRAFRPRWQQSLCNRSFWWRFCVVTFLFGFFFGKGTWVDLFPFLLAIFGLGD